MSKPKHVLFLEELSKNGIGYTNNIIPFLLTYFPTPFPNMPWLWEREGRPAYLFIEDLYHRNLIRFEDRDGEENRNIPFIPHDPQAFAESVLLCYITSGGLDYLDSYHTSQANYELNKSYKNVNAASLKSYKSQRILSWVAIAFAAASAIISYLGYNKTDETAKSVDRLRLQLKEVSIKLSSPQSQTSSHPPESHKP